MEMITGTQIKSYGITGILAVLLLLIYLSLDSINIYYDYNIQSKIFKFILSAVYTTSQITNIVFIVISVVVYLNIFHNKQTS